jgi:hypothetical protein
MMQIIIDIFFGTCYSAEIEAKDVSYNLRINASTYEQLKAFQIAECSRLNRIVSINEIILSSVKDRVRGRLASVQD